MQVFGATRDVKLALIGCQHGDELLGRNVIDRLRENLDEYPGLRLIVANEEAMNAGRRGVDGDLNRSYPGNPDGNHEERLAAKMLDTVADVPFVLDIHTTKSEVGVFPIIARLDDDVRRLLNATDLTRIAYMDLPHGGRNSGLANFPGGGLALEYHESYADDQFDDVFSRIETIVRRVLADERRAPQKREVFHITKLAPWDETKDLPLRNFEYSKALGGYSILPDGISYRGRHRGFIAPEVITERI